MKIFNLIILVWIPLTFFGQEGPPILKYPPQTYQAENQNWAVTQNKDKFVFVANNQGLLEYNGTDWTLYNSPNKTIIRSLKAFDNRIYSGAYMEFGYWERNSKGFLEYKSLSEKLASKLLEDENFWNIKTFDSWVVFQSFDRLYFYNTLNEELHYFTDESNYYRVFEINSELYVYKNDGILCKIEKGIEKRIVQLPESLNIQFVLNIFYDSNKDLILLTRSKGFFKVSNGVVSKWQINADDILKEDQIYTGIQLQDKSFVLGTISSGIVHVSQNGDFINNINQTNGLSNNTVLSLYEDIDGNVWAALDNGIDCLNMSSFIKEFNDIQGVIGTTYCSIIHQNNLYIGTNQGLFYKSISIYEPLKLVEGTKGQVWSLFEYNDELFCGHTSGTYLIEKDKGVKISSVLGNWDFRTIPNHPDLLLLGHYFGMSIIEKENGVWKLRNKLKGFENSARFFEITNHNEVWVNHEYDGLFKLKLNSDLTAFESVNFISDVPKGNGSGLLKYMGDLLYSYNEGVFKLDTLKQKFLKDSVYSELILKDNYVSGKLVKDTKERLWSFNKNRISYAEKSPIPGKMSIKSVPIQNYWRKTTVSFENLTHLDNDRYIIGRTNGYILADLDKFEKQPHHIFLNQVVIKTKDTIQYAVLNETGNFKFNQSSLKFNFSTPRYNKHEFVNYQYRLIGDQNTWSNWQTDTSVLFEKLKFGDYEFQVRSKIGNQVSTNTISFKFKINRPLYWSYAAIVAYIFGLILILFFIHRFNKRQFKKQHEVIMLENQRQLELQRIQADQEVVTLRNEKLNQQIEAKNRELAISTMSIVKRNKFLRGIKKQLKNNTNLSSEDPVFKLIDKNLDSSKDWDFFKDAFDNADKDFLDRAKKSHPKLTNNDLKFCAYLRLNLSSKEIAPLLNISVKSVEIRRYRLRKKMNLSHETNLTNYILTI